MFKAIEAKNVRQNEIAAKLGQWHESGRIPVIELQTTLVDFYGKDSQSCENLQYLINTLHINGHTRYVRAVLKLLPLYLVVEVTFHKADNAYTVKNVKGTPKAKKEKGKAELEAFAWDDLQALLQHPALNVVGKGKKGKKAEEVQEVSFRDAVIAELNKGATLEQLINMMAEIAAELSKATGTNG